MSEAKTVDVSLAILDPVPMEEAFGEIDSAAVETYQLFLSTTEPMLSDILRALHANAYEQAVDVAHSAKGAARMTGAYRLASVYSHIEQDSRKGDKSAALAWAELVPREFDVVRKEIAAVAARLG